METKLTLKLNQNIIERAKIYAASQQKSLSKLIETYLNAITTKEIIEDDEISPFVKSMKTNTKLPLDIEKSGEYQRHIEEKYR
jgi:Family of unknown function (DUF6364)